MNKRTFLKVVSAALTSPVLAPLKTWGQKEKITNWAGNLVYSTGELHTPSSVQQLQETITKYDRLKVLGTRHCFNTIADSTHRLVSTAKLNKVISLDQNARTVQVEAGIRYGSLAEYLHGRGFALHNLASLPHISVAGACTTATHGSGVQNGNLATAVTALELVAADGSVHTLTRDRDGEQFAAAVVGLGALGVVTKMTLQIEPAYNMRQVVYQDLPFDQFARDFEKIVSAGYSVSLFTDWQRPSFNEVWIKSRVAEGEPFSIEPQFFGALAAAKNLHPIAELSAENCTEQMGVPGPWHERLPHFKMGFTPSSGKELQAEYFVPFRHGVEAVHAVNRLSKQITPHIFISEIRTIAADNFWLSPCYGQPCVAIHFTWKQNWPAVKALLPKIEQELAPFEARPHWGKLFAMNASRLHSLYEKLPRFQQLAKEYDAKGKFRNRFLDAYVFNG